MLIHGFLVKFVKKALYADTSIEYFPVTKIIDKQIALESIYLCKDVGTICYTNFIVELV